MYVHFPLTCSYLQNINHSKYLQKLTTIRLKGTLGKGLQQIINNNRYMIDKEWYKLLGIKAYFPLSWQTYASLVPTYDLEG